MSGFTPGQIAVIVFGVLGLVVAGVRVQPVVGRAVRTSVHQPGVRPTRAPWSSSWTRRPCAYQLSDGGSTILVPQDKVYATRIAMSGKGLPASSQDGYALLDQQGITTSEFMQNVTYQRALEGELAKTIEAIDGVQSASVHLALPQKSVFTQDSEQATASVLVAMRGGVSLDSGQVQAITNLVASSVPKLAASGVTIADSTGQLLSGGSAADGFVTANESERSTQTENALSASAQTMLDRVLGPGNSAVRVHADLDFDQRETKTQSYQFVPGTPPLSSTSSTENYTGSGAGPGGILGSGTTGVTTTSTTQGNSYQKKSTNDTNAVGSVLESRTGAPGSVKRLTVAVLINAGAGSVDTTMLSNLVANAVGLDTRRGDTIQVEKMPFDHSAADAARQQLQATQSAQTTATVLDLARKVGVVLLVLLVLGLAFQSSRKQRRVLLDADELAALGSGHEPLAITWPDTPEIAGPSSPGVVVRVAPDVEARRIEQAHADVSDLVSRQPDEVAQLLRGWIAGGR